MSLLEKDIAAVIFDKLSLYLYEKEKMKERSSKEAEKKKFISHNTVIVTVNGHEIYNSKSDGVMSDELYEALLSYGADKNEFLGKAAKKRNRKGYIVTYNLMPSITSIVKDVQI